MFQIDDSLHWTDHFVEHGFGIVKGLIDTAFCEEAVEHIKALVNDPRPLTEWTVEKPGIHHAKFRAKSDPVLRKIYDQPALVDAIATMHGGPDYWNRRETFYFFVKPYDPSAAAELDLQPHIDYAGFVPILYRGFAMFIILSDNEPLSGNTVVWPGTHRIIQKQLMADPTTHQKSPFFKDFLQDLPDPYEFSGEAGDVMFTHHLLLHSGSTSHSANRIPRLAIVCDGWRDQWVTEIDPATPNLSPWLQSLAHNGAYKATCDERAELAKTTPEFQQEIEAEKNHPAG
jgi:hypothetical protein